MGDSACLIHGFSYASAIPNESKMGNPMHALGESVSFGRFMTESLSWEKWSTFSHKKYVEEAERYAQPGSVAQKKAFFEAHYKKIAAKKAAAAAALLEQEKAAKIEDKGVDDNNDAYEEERDFLNSHLDVDVKMEEVNIEDVKEDEVVNVNGDDTSIAVITANEVLMENHVKRISVNQIDNLENQETVSASGSSGSPKMDRPLLKQNFIASEGIPSVTSKKRSSPSSKTSSIQAKTWKVPPAPPAKPITRLNKENNVTGSTRKSTVHSMDKRRYSQKSLGVLMNLLPINEPETDPISATKANENSGNALGTPQDCATPLRTPASTKGVSSYSVTTPRFENKRIKTPLDPSVPGSKTGPKWHILSAVCSKSLTACRNKLQSPTISTPFIMRTEERAAKRKQKLEEKFNATEVQKIQQQKTLKEKAGKELRKLSCGFCFKARPLPDLYKERETPKNHTKKTPATQSQSAVLGRSISKETQGTISLPPPAKNTSKKNVLLNQSKLLTKSLTERTTHENASPNIHQ